MPKILVVHGAGMNMRGKAQIDVFGPMTLDDYNKKIQEFAKSLELTVEIFHSNIEGEIINAFYRAHDGDVDAAVINPAGFTVGAPALVGAIGQVRFPTIELHVSNPAIRGAVSEIARACHGTMTGFSVFGYYLALQAAKQLVNEG